MFRLSAHRTRQRAALIALLGCLSSLLTTLADPPDGYYNSVETTDATTLRATLHEVIDDHQRFPYTSGNTDTWDILDASSSTTEHGLGMRSRSAIASPI